MHPTHTARLISRITRLSTLITLVLMAVAPLLSVTCSHAVDSPAKSGAVQRLKTIIVNNYYPYTFVNEKGEPDGFSVEIARAVAKAMDFGLEIRADKWDVAIKELEAGRIDLLPMMARSPERDKIFGFSVPHTVSYDSIFLKKGSTGLRTLKDLSGKTVIVMNMDIAHSYLLSSGLSKTMTINLVDSLPEALKLLSAGKGDAAIMPKLVGIVTAKKLNLSDIETSPKLIDAYTRPFSFAVKDGNQALLERINQGLNIIKSSGEYDAIYNKWFGALEGSYFDLKKVLQYGAGVLLIFLGIFVWNVILKRQVKAKTDALVAEIGRRTLAEESLEAITLRQGAILASVPDIIMETDTNKVYTWANSAGLEFFGDDVVGKEASYYFEGEQNTHQIVQPLFNKSENLIYVESLQRRKDGTFRLLAWWSNSLVDEQGVLICVLSTARDITERKLAEETLKNSEEKYRNLYSHASLGIFHSTPDGRFIDVNPALARMLGYDSPEDVVSLITNISEQVYAEPAQRDAIEAKALAAGGFIKSENCYRRRDGTLRYGMLNMRIITDQEGRPIYNEGFVEDITENKRAEEALLESERRLGDILYSTADWVWEVDEKGIYTYTSPKGIEMFGNLIGETLFDFMPPDEAKRMALIFSEIVANRAPIKDLENWNVTKNGDSICLLTNGVPILDAEGRLRGYRGVDKDITDSKKSEEEKRLLEQQIQQTQKLESLGVLAGGIAHDFNNILAIIIGYCSLTKLDYENAEKNIPEIEKAAERAAALCRQMLAYAGKASLTQTQVNTCMLVDEIVTMLETTLQQNVVIKSDLGADIPTFTGDASQIRQVAMNLIINAAEAIGNVEGKIHVSLAKTEIKAGQSEKDHIGMIIPAGRYICFEVSDNGCGMDDETRRKIFEPFYTTKFTGRGLGMSAVLGIIKAHNGALQLESQQGHGTVFKVYLPVQIGDSKAEEAHHKAVSAPWQGSGTILLAEDEVQVKSIAITLLKMLGFNVIDAANGKEALELYQQNAADINLVVTDMDMPVMNGYELFYKLKLLNPQLPIIISSGFGEGDIASKIPREEIAGFINKPYKFELLRDVLKCVVEATTSTHV